MSQMPLQAKTRKWVSKVIFSVVISGMEDTICLSKGEPGFFLYRKSPIDLVRIILFKNLPYYTKPQAF